MNYDSENSVPAVWNIGDVILDLYEVKQVFSSGGMGLVYRVHHRDWNMDLAVKSPRPEFLLGPAELEHFERECETWVNLGLHPHTVACYYVRRLGGVSRTFAEFIAGGTLLDWIQNRQLYVGAQDAALRRILDVAIQVAWGLRHAHEQNLVHQDVKPSNVLMTSDGTAKVSDFGFAKGTSALRVDTTTFQEQTILVSSCGFTPAYCSPEQANREAVTRRTDIWSWAVSVLHMLVGNIAWTSGLAAPEALEHYAKGIVRNKHPAVPPASLTALLRTCLQVKPERRPQKMEDIVGPLREIYQSVTGHGYNRPEPRVADLMADGLNNRAVSVLDLAGPVSERHKRAEELLDRALQIDRHHAHATYNRGLLLWRSGRSTDETVLRALGEIRRAEPRNRVADYCMTRIHLERGDFESATALVEKSEQPTSLDLTRIRSALTKARGLHGETRTDVRASAIGSGQIQTVCLSPDERWFLSKHVDGKLRLWERSTCHCVKVLEGRGERLCSVFSMSNGRIAFLTLEDRILTLWDLESGQCISNFEGHTKAIICACVSSDGRSVLSGGIDVTPRLWDVAAGRCAKELVDNGPMGSVFAVAMSNDVRLGISAEIGGIIRVWHLPTGSCVMRLRGHGGFNGWIRCVCLSRDSRWVVSGGVDKTVRLWDLATGECRRVFCGHNASVTSVCMSPDHRLILSGSEDKTLRLWDALSGRCVRTFDADVGGLFSFDASPTGRWPVLSLDKGIIRLSEFQPSRSKQPYEIARPHSTSDLNLQATSVEDSVAAANELMGGNPAEAMGELMRARKVAGYEKHPTLLQKCREIGLRGRCTGLRGAVFIQQFKGHTQGVTSVCLSPDGRIAVSGSQDGMVGVWDVASGERMRVLRQHSQGVAHVCITRDSRRVVSGSFDNTLGLWDLATGTCLRVFDLGVSGEHTDCVNFVDISPDGRRIISKSFYGPIRIWDTTTGKCLRTIENNDGFDAACLSPDWRSIFTGGGDAVLRVWNLEVGTCVREFAPAPGAINALCVSPRTDQLVSGDEDGNLRLWNLSTGTLLRTLACNKEALSSVFVGLDGRWALSGSESGIIQIWDLAAGSCVDVLKGHQGKAASVCMSLDGRWVLSGGSDDALCLWELEWKYEFPPPEDFSESARPYLSTFLTLHQPCSEDGISRIGIPDWNDNDFQQLVTELRFRGLGWLRVEGVRRELEKMARERSTARGPQP